ncbi:MAG: glutamate-cysteine ligase family protein [Planctomycetota bacterium]|nr:glutamate-cysteine ligase family protein [Planctomycetota bacterium]
MTLHLFEGYGIELEYMLVDAKTLAVLPRADTVLVNEAGKLEAELERGDIAWSNELVLHVVELKTNGPVAAFEGVAARFQSELGEVARRIGQHGGRIMPTAMHPLMDPARESKLWPHEYGPVYKAFDRIFDCRGHGWSNLQSAHLNLPFGNDEEFGRLHAAIRLVLPLIPALAASSPVEGGRVTGRLDSRLTYYRKNCSRVPQVTGRTIPERVYSRQAYEDEIFAPMFKAMEVHDPEGTLRHEWLNARGAIARFDRDAIEIRLIDVQECPRMDIAVLSAIAALVQKLVERGDNESQRAFDEVRLERPFLAAIDAGEQALLEDSEYRDLLGLPTSGTLTMQDAWRQLADDLDVPGRPELDTILEHGPLSRRILAALGSAPDTARIQSVYRELCDCLDAGRSFRA